MKSPRRAARTLVTLGLLEDEDAVVSALDGSTWSEVLSQMGLSGDQLDEALSVIEVTSAPLVDDAVTPETDGRYEPQTVLGKGGMGTVSRSVDHHLHREIARKELLIQHPAVELRFLREARITAQLEHPGIVPVYELGRAADGTLYYTMKEVRGRTLRQALDSAPDLASRLQLLGVFVDLCQAVGYAHSKGVVHRDLKPPNVMIGAFGEVTVLDWGLAKVSGEPDADLPDGLGIASGTDSALTRAGTVMGTPWYMSPEQAAGRKDVDARSDVWSIGIMLYELLAGELPFAGSPDSVLQQVRDGVYAPVEQLEGRCPPALVAICHKALAHQPGDRYATAAHVADELEAWRTGATVGAHTYTALEQVRSAATRFRLGIVGLGGLLLGALVVYQVDRARQVVTENALLAEAERSAFLEELAWAQRATTRGRDGEALARLRHALSREAVAPDDRVLAESALDHVRHTGNVRILTTEPAGRFSWTASGGRLAWARPGAVALVDPDSGADLGEVAVEGSITTFQVLADESSLWIGTAEGVLTRMSLVDRSELTRLELGDPISHLEVSGSGSVLVRSGDGWRVFDPRGQERAIDASLQGAPLAWSGEDPVLADESDPHVARDSRGAVYRAEGAKVRGPLGEVYWSGGMPMVERIALDPAGQQLAVGSSAGLAVWSLEPGAQVDSNLRVCPDGQVVPVLPFPSRAESEAPGRACRTP